MTKLNQLIFDNFGVELTDAERIWFAADGKELRGSICAGDKRGEVLVAAVAHQSREIGGQAFYNGRKESEIAVLRKMLRESGLLHEKISLDAPHCNPQTLGLINQKGGVYLVGIKENQAQLLAQCVAVSRDARAVAGRRETEKGHGRVEQRSYQVFNLSGIYMDERWAECGISSLVRVERWRLELKTGRESRETSYYLSNQAAVVSELWNAVRGLRQSSYFRQKTVNHSSIFSLQFQLEFDWTFVAQTRM